MGHGGRAWQGLDVTGGYGRDIIGKYGKMDVTGIGTEHDRITWITRDINIDETLQGYGWDRMEKGWDICNRDMDGTWRPGMAGTRCYRGMEGTLWENMGKWM